MNAFLAPNADCLANITGTVITLGFASGPGNPAIGYQAVLGVRSFNFISLLSRYFNDYCIAFFHNFCRPQY